MRALPIIGLVLLAAIASAYEGILFWNGYEGSPGLLRVWNGAFLLFTVLWVDVDSKRHPSIYRPFEFGQLVFWGGLFYVPYYLWATRRFSGLLILVAFMLLYEASYITQWILYAAL